MKYALILALCLTFISCATITRGIHEKLQVVSDPPAANVQLSTGETGITPVTIVKKRRTENFSVTVSKPGYISETVRVESKFSATGGTAMAGNALVGGVIGIGVDAVSGAYNSLYPNPVSVRLKPTTKAGQRRTGSTTSKAKPANEPANRSAPAATSTPQTTPTPR